MTTYEKIYEAVRQIPEGCVATYGQVAEAAGNPRLSRVVGYALHVNPQPGIIPCHRVVKKNGEVSPAFAFGGQQRQVELLKAEGVGFLDDTHVDMTRFRVLFLPSVCQPDRLKHPFGPLFNEKSTVLILGSFPSVKSREQEFFYGHPQNRFWQVISAQVGAEVPRSIPEKKALILDHGLALWDVIAECTVVGSSDASIRDVRANDLNVITEHCPIRRICCNGKTAWQLYEKYIRPATGIAAQLLPSTSPANAQWTLDRLIEAWRVILRDETA